MIVTVCGIAGSGKSTIAKALAKRLNFKHYSMGDLQRKFAKDRGITVEELGRLEAKDDKIDREVDAYQAELSKKEDNFVIDSWLGFYFIPKAIKVFLDCDEDVAAERIYNDIIEKRRDSSQQAAQSVEETKKINKERIEVNRQRWIRYYNVDFLDKTNYDVVIDTSKLAPGFIVDKIIQHIKDKGLL